MRLLVFASLLETAPANFFIRAFKELGHEVRVVSDVEAEGVHLRACGAVDAEVAAGDFAPDVALFFEGGTMRLLPVGLERLGCPTGWYGIDTHMNYAKHMRLARLFDVSFIAQKEFLEPLRGDGVRRVIWLPLAFEPGLLPDPMPARDLDIAHVGSMRAHMNPARHRLIAQLCAAFPNSHFGEATPAEMGRLYARARMVFNRSIKNDVNMRYFEAMGAGAVLLTDAVVDNGADELFTPGVHYVVYSDDDGLMRSVRELLADPARMEAIGLAARTHALAHHTYRHRAEAMLSEINRDGPRAAPVSEDVFAACLSVDLLGGAALAAAAAFRAGDGGYRRVVGGGLALALKGIAHALFVAERFRGKRR